jgi:hypothetical protein
VRSLNGKQRDFGVLGQLQRERGILTGGLGRHAAGVVAAQYPFHEPVRQGPDQAALLTGEQFAELGPGN